MTEGNYTQLRGLTEAEVKARIDRGEVNKVVETTGRTYAEIIRSNIFTLFNAILGVLFVVILLFGSARDALFGIVLISNALIGIVQEVRAKWTLDRLTLLSAPKARVIREGKKREIPMGEVVLDDLLALQPGDQIVADGVLIISEALSVDESMLTGESEPVNKAKGDTVLSGSLVIAGTGIMRATKIGEQAYARKLALEARRFSPVHSELQDGINIILRYITWIMPPAAFILIISQLRTHISLTNAVSGSAAGIVGMIPQGLVLLTSAAFAVSIISLGRRNVLIQQLPAVEVLARVDTLCLDKTGTITEGALVFDHIEPFGFENGAMDALGALAAESSYQNPTLAAIAAKVPAPKGWHVTSAVPFSSARKWSGASFEKRGTWILGAPEVLLGGTPSGKSILARVNEQAESGSRVLLLMHGDGTLKDEMLPDNAAPAALVVLTEKIRPDAAPTLHYFREQGVTVKVISGDNPTTVGVVAKRAGVKVTGEPVDARSLPTNIIDLAGVMEENTVFGRVSPQQKQAMVKALQSKGHTVAMTGDGVNDILALKDADLGIAMGSGTPATKSIAELVLLNGEFSTLPSVVAEGRRVIANIERVANLFVTKTVYATLITIAIAIIGGSYPLLPRHLTLIDALTIGTPAFLLSFAPSKKLYRPGFIVRVLRFAIPAGTVATLALLISYEIALLYYKVSLIQARTIAALVLVLIGFWVLALISRPITMWRAVLIIALLGVLGLVLGTPDIRQFLALSFPGPAELGMLGIITGVAIILITIAIHFVGRDSFA